MTTPLGRSASGWGPAAAGPFGGADPGDLARDPGAALPEGSPVPSPRPNGDPSPEPRSCACGMHYSILWPPEAAGRKVRKFQNLGSPMDSGSCVSEGSGE